MESVGSALLLLMLPLCVLVLILHKNWADKELLKAFACGIAAGVLAIAAVRLAYLPIEASMGLNIRDFLSASGSWFITICACIGIVGITEETIKTLCAMLVSRHISFTERPAAVFMAFIGCAASFSIIENAQYFFLFGHEVIFPRILISSTAHLFFSAVSAIFTVKAFASSKTRPLVSALRISLGIFSAALFHGLFDFALFHWNLSPIHGVLIFLVVFFIYGIKESWTEVLKYDLPLQPSLMICTGCRALTIEPSRFCGFCGSRVMTHKISEKK